MQIDNQGSVVLFIPENKTEKKWLQDNTQAEDWQWLGSSLVVDHRMAHDLAEAVAEEGFISQS
jgi:hypothetical protein